MQRVYDSGNTSVRRLNQLDSSALEHVCNVVRRTLVWQYRTATLETIGDAVQEAACRYCEQDSLRAEVNVRTIYVWVLTVARHELSRALRREDWFAPGSVSEGSADQESAVEISDDRFDDDLTCRALLDRISPTLAEAVRMHFDGFTAQEIALHIGCTEAAAHKRVQRGCRELRRLWRQEEMRVRHLLIR